MNFADVKAMRVPVNGTPRDVRRIAIGGATVWEKPLPYDAEVEYIESAGNEPYINTGVGITPSYRIEADFAFTQVTTRQQRVFEQYDSSGHLFVSLYINTNGNIACGWGQTTDLAWTNITASTDRMLYVFDGPNRLLAVGANQKQLPIIPDTGPPNSAKLTLGAANQTGAKPTYGRWYSAKISLGGVPVRDFIPVRVGTEGCLYDRVSRTLFHNAGGGAFIVGPDATS